MKNPFSESTWVEVSTTGVKAVLETTEGLKYLSYYSYGLLNEKLAFVIDSDKCAIFVHQTEV